MPTRAARHAGRQDLLVHDQATPRQGRVLWVLRRQEACRTKDYEGTRRQYPLEAHRFETSEKVNRASSGKVLLSSRLKHCNGEALMSSDDV